MVYVRVLFSIFYLSCFSMVAFCQVGSAHFNVPSNTANVLSNFQNDSGYNKMLILAPSQWIDELQPLADWKNQSGVTTTIADVTLFAHDYPALKNYIYQFYLANGITHVLLAGDYNVITSPTASMALIPSDPQYGYLNGNDCYPEVFVGRFPAENDSDIITMVARTIEYEKNPDTTSWLSNAAVLGSNQGPGDDNEMDWEHLVNIKSQLLNYTFSNVAEFYDGSHSGTTDGPGDPTTTDVMNVFNSGISLLNYTGHGAGNSFTTSGFSVNEILNLNNKHKLPLVISAGCTNGNFMTGSICMGEAFLRDRNNGDPVGATAAFLSAANQYWNPPMDAQDAINSILTENDSLYKDHTFGGIVFSGCNRMIDNYGMYGSVTAASWHCFGDPSLMVRTKIPEMITAVHPSLFTTGDTSFTVTCPYDNVIVTLFQDGRVISKSRVFNGIAQLSFNQINSLDSVILTLSGYNLYPYIIKIPVDTSAAPVLAAQLMNINDATGNNNLLADYSEQVMLDLKISNSGNGLSGNAFIYASSGDPYVSILSTAPDTFTVAGMNEILLSNAIELLIADSVRDGHVSPINVVISDSAGKLWNSTIMLPLHAPVLRMGAISINDAAGNNNGTCDAGENVNIEIQILNDGSSTADSIDIIAIMSDPYLGNINDTIRINLQAASDTLIEIPAIVAVNAPMYQYAFLNMHAVMQQGYNSDNIYEICTGYITESLSNGNMPSGWSTWGDSAWFVSAIQSHSPGYSWQSGNISNNGMSSLNLTLNVVHKDSFSFWYATDCESTWDYLEFSIDSQPVFQASGLTSWKYYSLMLDTGIHHLSFIYKKDNVASAGADAAWIDDIMLPESSIISGLGNTPLFQDLKVFPVPADQFINISVRDISLFDHFSIYAADGRMVKGGRVNGSKEISIRDIPEGFYIIRLSGVNSDQSVRFIISRK